MRAQIDNEQITRDDDKLQQQPAELAKKANIVEDFCNEGMRARKPYERQWFINMAFFMGKQWVQWDSVTRRLHVVLDPKHRKRVTVNRIMPAVMKEVSRMTKAKPKYFVVPEEPTEESKEIARAGDDLINYLDRELQIKIKNHDLLKYMTIYGTAFKDIYWNPLAGDKIVNEETGEQVSQGEVGQEILSPFHVIREPGAIAIDDMNRIVITKQRSIEWVKRQYPEWGYLVKAGEDNQTLSAVEEQLNNLLTEGRTKDYGKSGKDNKGFVNVKEYRELPSEKHPEGRVIIEANKILLAEGRLPLQWQRKERKLGVLQYNFINIPDRPYGRSYVEDMIPTQTEYNKTLSQIIEHRNVTRAKFIKARGHNLKFNPDNEVGQVIEFNPIPNASEPRWLDAPNIPAYMKDLLEVAKMDLNDISSQHQVSRGQKPPGVTANVAIETLIEMDSTQFSTVHERYSDLEAEAGMMMLKTVKEKYTEPRKIEIVSPQDELQVKYLNEAQNLPTKIIIERDSSLGELKTVKQQKVLELIDRGIIDINNRREIFKMLEFGGLEEKIKDETADESRAELENKRIQSDLPIRVQHFDVHEIHLEVHNNYRKSTEYEKLPKEQQQKIDRHVAITGGAMAGLLKQNADGQWEEVPPEEVPPPEPPPEQQQQPQQQPRR